MSKGRYIKKASNNLCVKQGLRLHVIVEEHLHIITFGPKSHSADFFTIFFFVTAGLLIFYKITMVMSYITELRAEN
jgi:hypothetical protein